MLGEKRQMQKDTNTIWSHIMRFKNIEFIEVENRVTVIRACSKSGGWGDLIKQCQILDR